GRGRSGRVRALMAAGRAGANARRELYRDYETIPPRGALAALTVPGAVAGWMLALEAASAYGGRLRLGDLLAPAIADAREGTIVTRSQARFTAEKLAELEDVPGFAPTFLLDGKPPEAGATLKQAALAATLDHLAHAGLDDFYRGDVGREMTGDLDRVGSPVARPDLQGCRAPPAPPRAALGRARCRPPVQPPAADAGPGVIDHSRAVRALAHSAGRGLRSHPHTGRGDQAGLRRARSRDRPSR